MRFFRNGCHEPYTHIVATGEKSGGNDSVGDMWLETKVFNKETTIDKIIDWAYEASITGKLIITISEPEKVPVEILEI